MRSPARPPSEQQGQAQGTARVSTGLQGLAEETARESTGLTQEELVHREWEDVMLKRTRLVKKMGRTAFIEMASIIESSGEQTPPQQPREPTAQPTSEMPEGQKAEATAKHRRKEEGPKQASFTGPVKANGRTAKRCKAPTARNSQEGIGGKIKRLKRNGPERHISSQPAQPSRERSEGPKRARLTGKGRGGGVRNAPAKSSRKQPAGPSRSGTQTPPQQQRKPTAQPTGEGPATRKKMPEHQKAEATAQPRRKNDGPKRASGTGAGARRGRTPEHSQAIMARNSREGTGPKRKHLRRDGPRRHISSRPTQPSREKKKGPKRASLTGKGEGGGDSNGPAKASVWRVERRAPPNAICATFRVFNLLLRRTQELNTTFGARYHEIRRPSTQGNRNNKR
jgi:hypothetical protein